MAAKLPVLIVEDDASVREQLAGALEDEGFGVVVAGSYKEGTARLRQGAFALVLTDLCLPDASGLEIIEQARAEQRDCPVLVITAHASVDTAVEAMRRGAFHYLPKPFSIESLLAEVDKALEHGRALRERRALREKLSAEQGLGRILGASPAIVALRRMIAEVAGADSTVLITGETGTGKELVANAVHYESARAGGPLVKVNCAALSENLLESELFGHEKGAFTGAERCRAGRFERADGGTLFLDEISEMGAHVQAKLLRVLQGEPFERVGGDEPVRTDVRIVAATNRDPRKAVEEGRLRGDLLYRLDIVRIDVPPLRERREDVPLLAESFLAAYAAKAGKPAGRLSAPALAALAAHGWPGNVRELENCIERAVILCRGKTIGREDLPAPLSGVADGRGADLAADGPLNLQELEKGAVLRALRECAGNKSQAARLLGIFPSTLYKKMRRFGIPIGRK